MGNANSSHHTRGNSFKSGTQENVRPRAMTIPLQRKKRPINANSPMQVSKSKSNNNNENESSLLTNFQKTILLQSWQHHSFGSTHSANNIGVRIYSKLFEKCPQVKAIFGFDADSDSTTMYDDKMIKQARRFVTVIDYTLKNLDRLEHVIRPMLFTLGGKHVKMIDFGFKQYYWDVFAECMLECLIESQGVRKHRDFTIVWRTLITWIVGVMKEGYHFTLKSQRHVTALVAPFSAVSSSEVRPIKKLMFNEFEEEIAQSGNRTVCQR